MTTKQYHSALSLVNYDKHRLREKRVVITYAKRKPAYRSTINAIGTIKNTSSGSEFGILLDDFVNPASSKGLYWFTSSDFDFIDSESEENNMSKLTGYKAVAVVDKGYNKYHFAIYENGRRYKKGDRVIVSGSNVIQTIDEIITPDEATLRFKGNITAEVICVVDMTDYEKRVERRKIADELKKSMDKVIKEMQEVDKYEMYANQNPALKEMLDKYKELVG